MNNDESSKPLPWYKNGLRFQCTECGKCCTGSPGYVWVSEEEIQSMARFLNLTVDLFKRKYLRLREKRYALVEKKASSDCIFLKDKKCQIYQTRPKQCRTFPWWKENLHSEESWKLAAQNCEGIQPTAPLVAFQLIQKALEEAPENDS